MRVSGSLGGVVACDDCSKALSRAGGQVNCLEFGKMVAVRHSCGQASRRGRQKQPRKSRKG